MVSCTAGIARLLTYTGVKGRGVFARGWLGMGGASGRLALAVDIGSPTSRSKGREEA